MRTKLITLTQEQVDSVRKVVLNNLSETLPVMNKALYEWWRDNVLGYIPNRIDRIEGETFKVYSNPK